MGASVFFMFLYSVIQVLPEIRHPSVCVWSFWGFKDDFFKVYTILTHCSILPFFFSFQLLIGPSLLQHIDVTFHMFEFTHLQIWLNTPGEDDACEVLANVCSVVKKVLDSSGYNFFFFLSFLVLFFLIVVAAFHWRVLCQLSIMLFPFGQGWVWASLDVAKRQREEGRMGKEGGLNLSTRPTPKKLRSFWTKCWTPWTPQKYTWLHVDGGRDVQYMYEQHQIFKLTDFTESPSSLNKSVTFSSGAPLTVDRDQFSPSANGISHKNDHEVITVANSWLLSY